jgi:hypothetical protein
MKKILKVISWCAFYVSMLAAIIAVLSSACALVLLMATVFNPSMFDILVGFAIAYVVSMAIIVAVYLMVCIYRLVEKVTRK